MGNQTKFSGRPKPRIRRRHASSEAPRALRRLLPALVAAVLLVALPRPARAFEVSGGVSAGGIMAGIVPRFALSAHAGLSWNTERGFLFEAQNLVSTCEAEVAELHRKLHSYGVLREREAVVRRTHARRVEQGHDDELASRMRAVG